MTKKQLNKNVVVGLTLFAFAFIIVVSVLMLRQLQSRDPKYYTELAKQYEQERDWKKAALFYREAWERSDDAIHLVALGDMLLNDGEVANALGSWRTVLINQPNLIDAHLSQIEVLLELARLYGRIQDWETLAEATQAFLGTDVDKSPAEAARAHNALGLALLNLVRLDPDNAELSEEALLKAVELDENTVEYALDLAAHYIRQDRAGQAEQIYRELIARTTMPAADKAKVRLTYARRLSSLRRFNEAERYFEESRALAQSDPEALRSTNLGYSAFRSQQWARAVNQDPEDGLAQDAFEEAEAILRECIESDPDDFEPYLNLAVLYTSAARYTDAVDVCEARLQRGFSRKGVEGPRNRINTFRLMLHASEACVAQALTAHGERDKGQREAYLARAEQYVADARGEFPSHPRLFTQAGRVKLARGLDRPALEDFRAAEDAYRSYDTINWENKLTLAQLHLRLNEPGAAKAVLDEALGAARRERAGDVGFWTLYARVLFANNEYDRALAAADRILAVDPDNSSAVRLKAAIYERTNRPEDAGRLFESVTGDRVARAILTARQIALEGDDEAVVATLREALDQDPGDPRLVGEAVREFYALDQVDKARDVVEAALAVDPDNVQFQRLSLLMRKDLSPDERDRAMLEIIEELADPYQRALALVGFHVRKQEAVEALKWIDEALQHFVDQDTPMAQNATIAQQRTLLKAKMSIAATLDDADAMEGALETGRQYNVDGADGQSILGLYHMHRKEYELAVKAFRQAVAAQPTDARSFTHLGQCLHVLGRTEEAKEAYERAVGVNPREGHAHRGLAAIAEVQGDTAGYERAMATCERLIPRDPWVQAALLARRETDDPLEAIARREKLLENRPDDVQNLQRLASLCETVGDLAKADSYHARLVELLPGDKDLMVNVSKYYRRTGRPERSLDLVTNYAASRATPEETANTHILIAAHYLGEGDSDAAQRALLAGANIAETFEITQSLAEFYFRAVDHPNKALVWLDKAVKQARASQSPRLPRIMASRISCLLHRKVNDIETARSYVDELLAEFPDYPQGLLLRSEVHGRAGEIEEAVDSLSEYLARHPDDPYALYQRALHRRAQGRLRAAIGDLEAVRRAHPVALDLEPRLLLARLYQQAGRKDMWIRELESLVQDAPDAAPALEELLQTYIHEERFTDAEQILTGRINRTAADPDERWFFLRGRISLMLGDDARALADFTRAAEISGYTADAVRRVLDLHIRLDRATDGVEYFKQFAPTKNPTPVLLSRFAVTLAKADMKPEAAQQFRRAMRLAVFDSATTRRALAADLRAALPTDEAISLFEGYEIDGAMTRANDRILVTLYETAGRFTDAASRLERLIATCVDDGERADLHHELGDLRQITDDPLRARQAYEEALKYDDQNWITLNNLAYLLADGLGEDGLARPYAEQAVALADNANTLDTLGWIYVGLGEYPLAIAELSRAIRLDPGNALTYYHLGEAYRRAGRFNEATSVLSSGASLVRTSPSVANPDELVSQFEVSLQRVEESDSEP